MTSRSTNALPPALRVFVAISLTIFVPTWVLAIASTPRRERFPMLLPFLNDGRSFSDFWEFLPRFQHLHTEAFFAPGQIHFSYFPAAVPLYNAFYRFGAYAMAVYLVVVIGAAVAGSVLFGRALVRAGLRPRSAVVLLVVAFCCAFPAIFAVERGNLEIIVAIGMTTGVWAFVTGRMRLAAVLWGIFGAVKLYPLLLAGVFLARRRWVSNLLLTLLTTIGVTVLALEYTGPTFAAAAAGLRGGPGQFLADFTLKRRAIEWDHSLFAVLKLFQPMHGYHFAPMLTPYFFTAGGVMLLVYAMRMRRLPVTNQLVALSVCLVLLPPTSFEYTLMELYGAWGVLVLLAVKAAAGGRTVRGLWVALGLMAVLFSPLRLVMLHGMAYGGQLQCGLLVALLVVALWQPWPPLPVEQAMAARTVPERGRMEMSGAGAAF